MLEAKKSSNELLEPIGNKEALPLAQFVVVREKMKKAVVIGGSSGIGRELSKILQRNEYAVGVMARRVHLLEELMDNNVFVEQIEVLLSIHRL